MAYSRFNGNVVPFASEATGTNRTVFGDTVQSDDIDSNLNADFKKGWEIVGINDNPTKQDFNALAFTISNLTAYLYQQGVAEWNTDQDYLINSWVSGTDGELYKSLSGTVLSPNNGNNPLTDNVNWISISDMYEFAINTLTNKTTPVDADELVIADSDSSFSLKKLSFTNLQATLLSYFDTLYSRKSTIFGIGQTWQVVTASRALGITYTNSTGKPIEITATISGIGAGTTTAKGLVDGVEITRSWAAYTTSGPATGAMVTFIVPIGGTYLVDLVPGTITQTLYSWSELR